ncbi:MAG: hypothetical protein IPG60_11120 [Bacteroidetes bacterium]|nr:hypothetical protein [Bacteroidota bacterium]
MGSGQHTNSHMLLINGYLYQAPITFYTQKQQWDLAPGMEGGFNSRFSRIIESECLACHNGLPQPVVGSINKYVKFHRELIAKDVMVRVVYMWQPLVKESEWMLQM